MGDFVDVQFTVDANQLVDNAIAALAAQLEVNGFPGWTAHDANLEIIQLGVVGQMAAEVAALAAQVPSAIFRTFGTQLFATPYKQGASATIQTTWTLADTAGHTIKAGTFLTVDGLGFSVQDDVVVTAGSSTATVLLVAVAFGEAYNDLGDTVAPITEIDWVTSVAAIGRTSGGTDQESDADYQDRLAAELALQAPRPITAADYAGMALVVPDGILPAGVTVGRATAIDGFNPAATNFTGTTTSGSATVTAVSSFTGLTAGSLLTGTGIPANTRVLSVNTGASTLLMSANATGSATVTITSTGSYNNSRCVTVFVTDATGAALSAGAMTALQTWLTGFRELNFLVFVNAPTTTLIYVTYQVHALPGYDTTALVSSVNAAIASYLNPATWGTPSATTTGLTTWLNSAQGFSTIRYNKLLGVIESVPGVDYVPSGSAGLAIGTAAAPTGVADITLPGPVPLPSANTTTPTIVGSTV